jgi:2-polyprenyl-6-methoxyphenol hydroxylase-like FAD-dependent oxidoreductase
MGGLLAARTLADFFDQVTVIERDALRPGHRRGVPQGQHFHTILLRGAQVLDTLFPGLVNELVADGAPRVDLLREARLIIAGHQLIRTETGATAVQLTRPMLEDAVRARVAAIPNVKIVDGFDAVGLVGAPGRITGIRTVNRAATSGLEEILDADLVVDAMGRAGRAARWLADLGYRPPAADQIKVDITYLSRLVRIPDGALGTDRLVLVGPAPGRTKGFALAAQEGGLWMLTAFGMAGAVPPADCAALADFLQTSAPREVAETIRTAEPVSEPRVHKFPASIRRRYERLRDLPGGLIAFGDAICSFNPIYGQGMTVAAVQAEALHRCLRDGEQDLGRRFFRAAAKAIDPAWTLSAGGDLALPEIEGHRPLATRMINRYIARAQRAGVHDARLATMFVRVGGLLDPPASIFAPGVLARVLTSRA